MKKIFCVLLSILLCVSCCFAGASAKTTYNAKWTMTAKVGNTSYNSGDTITVNPGSTVQVTVHLSNNYYVGPTCFQIFYNNKIFSNASSGAFNTSGKLYSVCGKSYCTFVDWQNVHPGNRDQGWPKYSSDKLAEFKKNNQFLRVTMTPNVQKTTTTVGKLNEDLLTITFNVSNTATAGSTGEIILPIESMRNANNPTGYFYCTIYKTSDLLGDKFIYSNDQSFDCSKAVLKFKVASSAKLGDVNKDGRINSSDALLVLQSSVGSKTLTAEQKALADVNKDSKINSTDALQILRFSVGAIKNF